MLLILTKNALSRPHLLYIVGEGVEGARLVSRQCMRGEKKFQRSVHNTDAARSGQISQIWKQDLHIWKTSQIWEIGPQIWPDLAASVYIVQKRCLVFLATLSTNTPYVETPPRKMGGKKKKKNVSFLVGPLSFTRIHALLCRVHKKEDYCEYHKEGLQWHDKKNETRVFQVL